jgi:hypothetical protein
MTMQDKMNNNKKNDVPKCVFSCGRIATGIINLSENTETQLCDVCHRLLDPDDKMMWVPF